MLALIAHNRLVATVIGVSIRAVQRWRRGQRRPQGQNKRRLLALFAILRWRVIT
jgi:DNA-binding transcriptional regulator YiaG